MLAERQSQKSLKHFSRLSTFSKIRTEGLKGFFHDYNRGLNYLFHGIKHNVLYWNLKVHPYRESPCTIIDDIQLPKLITDFSCHLKFLLTFRVITVPLYGLKFFKCFMFFLFVCLTIKDCLYMTGKCGVG